MLYVNPLENAPLPRGDFGKLDAAKRRIALEELEHHFARLLLKEMRDTIPRDGLLSGSPQQRQFEDMLDDALSQEWAKTGQLGIARFVEEQLNRADASRAYGSVKLAANTADK